MMKNKSLILASASPRRKELLEDSGFAFVVEASTCEEHLDTTISLEEAIEKIALQKAEDVFRKHEDSVVLGCDTMVVFQGEALGKPSNKQEAKEMLTMLSGQTHYVISGVAILSDDVEVTFHEVTKVTFYEIDDELLTSYIHSDEPYDKAGAYGIQGKGKLFVESLQGDYYNVMGLPIAKIYRILKSSFFQ